jgi:hypothetical protein
MACEHGGEELDMARRLAVPILACAAVGGVAFAQEHRSWDFQGDALGAPPAGFTFGRTGQGPAGRWVVLADPSAPAGDHVLAQVDDDGTDYRFPVAVADTPAVRDVRAEVRCKAVAGKVDRACGLTVRFRDADNYYVARANALEDNVNLYRVVGGRRVEIGGWRGKVASGTWHSLALEARGQHLRVIWEGQPIIEATDDTLREAGRIGVWTKADSVTHFDALTVSELR